jgi:hypothetical protein
MELIINFKTMDNFEFLKSNRFWALILGAVAFYLKQKGLFGDAEMMLIATITAGFVTIRTVDRATEKMGCDEPESLEEQ